MSATRNGFVVFSFFDVPEHLDAEFDEFWRAEYLPHKLTVPGVSAVRRFGAVEDDSNPYTGSVVLPRVGVMFEIESSSVLDDPQNAAARASRTRRGRELKAQFSNGHRNLFVERK